jgi:hypothetical protein
VNEKRFHDDLFYCCAPIISAYANLWNAIAEQKEASKPQSGGFIDFADQPASARRHVTISDDDTERIDDRLTHGAAFDGDWIDHDTADEARAKTTAEAAVTAEASPTETMPAKGHLSTGVSTSALAGTLAPRGLSASAQSAGTLSSSSLPRGTLAETALATGMVRGLCRNSGQSTGQRQNGETGNQRLFDDNIHDALLSFAPFSVRSAMMKE